MSHIPQQDRYDDDAHGPSSHIVQWPSDGDMTVLGDAASVRSVLEATSSYLHGCADCAAVATMRVAASHEALMVLTRVRRAVATGIDAFCVPEVERCVAEHIATFDAAERLGFAIGEVGRVGTHIRRLIGAGQ